MSVGHNLPNLAIGYSRGRLLAMLAGCLMLTLLFTAIALNLYRGKDISDFQTAVCYFGVALSGLATLKTLWMLISSREATVFLSRVGIRDKRLADETIAWSAVRDISIRERRSVQILVLKIDPLVAQRFAGGFLKRLMSLLDRGLGADVVIVNAGGLTMDPETLFETCRQYWGVGRSAYRSEPEPDTQPEPVS
jgi:hypothetical protein